MPPLNVLYIHSHDTGTYIQPYGHAIPTPNLQRLAEQGVLFRNAFTTNPTCSPSRAALLTGQYPHENGMFGLAHRGFYLDDPSRHLANHLARNGYHTVLAGVQHVAHGKEAVEAIDYRERHRDHQGAIAFLRDAPKQPFFLAVGFMETHRAAPPNQEDFFRDVDPLDARYVRPPDPLPDTPETRDDLARYAASARTLDRKMGQVFDALDEAGLAENTLVICTTDHGIAFPRMKCNLEDDGTHVMLMLRGPGPFSGGKVVDALVSQLDLYPTVCALAGIDPPNGLRGTSLVPLVAGEVEELHDTLFAEVNYHCAFEPIRSARTTRWKYVRRFEPAPGPILCNTDRSPSKALWIKHGWPTMAPAREALYDLVFDPHERDNLADSPGHTAVLEDMRARLDVFMQATGDPAGGEGVPMRPRWRANRTTDVDPQDPMLPPGQR